MDFIKTLPELARHEYKINYATGNFTLKITDYVQCDILKNFIVQREYNSLAKTWKFNIEGRPQKVTLQTLREVFFIYEGKNLIAVQDEIGRTTRYDYAENLLTCVTYPDGTKIKYSYDYKKNLTTCIEGGTKIFQNEYDEFGRLVKITDASGTRNFFYDDKNRQTIESGRDDITYKWTRRKLIEKIFYADGSFEFFMYDADFRLNYKLARNGDEYFWRYTDGLLTREILPDGMIISYEHDASGNLIRKHDSDGREEIYFYSSKNLLIGKKVRLNIKDWRREKFERDMAGRILTHDINGQVTSYAYDEEAPAPSLIKTPCGYKFTCIYDKVYRLLEVKTEFGEFFFAHTPMNKIVAAQKDIFAPIEKPEKIPNDADIKIFDVGDRLIEVRQKVGDKFKLVRWKYDLNDNCIERREWLDLQTVQSATGRVKVTQYEYDAQNRLVFEFDGENVAKYYYDCLNNLTLERRGKFSY
ncbi:MAG: RHS repeat protein [Selenomonadaceae bacterium]|nr:RHS repeat protein [Selenomonadaceae bacterium]